MNLHFIFLNQFNQMVTFCRLRCLLLSLFCLGRLAFHLSRKHVNCLAVKDWQRIDLVEVEIVDLIIGWTKIFLIND